VKGYQILAHTELMGNLREVSPNSQSLISRLDPETHLPECKIESNPIKDRVNANLKKIYENTWTAENKDRDGFD